MDDTQLTDEEVARRVQKGDIAGFEILVERYRQKLLRYGGKLLFNRSDLEDIVQEVFIKAYRNLKGFDPDRKFSSWIYRIAHNEFINHGKKFSRQVIDYFDFEVFLPRVPQSKSPEEDFDAGELKGALDASLNRLKEKYREPLALHYLEGLDYKEIADVLQLPVNTVGIRIMRGKEQLRKIFNKDDGKRA